MATNELLIPEIEALQDQPEVTHNDALAILDGVLAASLDIDVSSNSGDAHDTDLLNYYLRYRCFGTPSGAVTLTVDDFGGKRFFMVFNDTDQVVTVAQTGAPGTTVDVYPGVHALIYADNGGAFDLFALELAGTRPFRSTAVQVFTTPGAGTYTPTAGMLYCLVEVQAGGGGGGGSAAPAAGQGAAGGGGGSGAYTAGWFTAAQIGASKAFSIGAGGAGGAAGANNGFDGGATTFNTTDLVVAGGIKGLAGASVVGPAFVVSGAGGAVTTPGTEILPGSAGVHGGVMTAGVSSIGGQGGASRGGAGGAAGFVSDGGSGIGNGAGGGGGADVASGSGRAGGTGTDGFVRVTEYLS